MPSTPHAALPTVANRVSQAAVSHRLRWLSPRLSERKVLLYALDLFAITFALLATLALRLELPFGWQTVASHPVWFGLLIGQWTLCAPLLGMYDPRTATGGSTGATPPADRPRRSQRWSWPASSC